MASSFDSLALTPPSPVIYPSPFEETGQAPTPSPSPPPSDAQPPNPPTPSISLPPNQTPNQPTSAVPVPSPPAPSPQSKVHYSSPPETTVYSPNSVMNSTSPPKNSSSGALGAGVTVAVVVVILLGLGAFWFYRRRRKTQDQEQVAPRQVGDNFENSSPWRVQLMPSPMDQKQHDNNNNHKMYFQPELQQQHAQSTPSVTLQMTQGQGGQGTYTFNELLEATNGFSSDNLLGQGGFGQVFKGTLNGMEVAVKKLRQEGDQGDREFMAEVDIISRVHHKNLVSLVGHCIHEDQRLLVYEFVPNKTLDFHLRENGEVTLNWQNRFKIALGAARGLAYLHEDCNPKVIHRDIKASNILLNSNFEPKVADFGLAKYQAIDRTHVTTRIMGTFGYIAPEFVTSGRLTDKADVFAFGVVLLELITGRPPVQSCNSYVEETLVGWARPLLARALEDKEYDDLIDPRLGMNYDPYGIVRIIECASAAVRQTPRHRPSMIQIVQHLQGEIVAVDLHVTPGESSSISSNSFWSSDEQSGIIRPKSGQRGYASSEFSDQSGSQNPITLIRNEPSAR
ncbi:hypothetical protein LUZ60_000522 [Juncus effusus]|nr:hypothetical protein LUZ60_000522 [Juncus effusus]